MKRRTTKSIRCKWAGHVRAIDPAGADCRHRHPPANKRIKCQQHCTAKKAGRWVTPKHTRVLMDATLIGPPNSMVGNSALVKNIQSVRVMICSKKKL